MLKRCKFCEVIIRWTVQSVECNNIECMCELLLIEQPGDYLPPLRTNRCDLCQRGEERAVCVENVMLRYWHNIFRTRPVVWEVVLMFCDALTLFCSVCEGLVQLILKDRLYSVSVYIWIHWGYTALFLISWGNVVSNVEFIANGDSRLCEAAEPRHSIRSEVWMDVWSASCYMKSLTSS